MAAACWLQLFHPHSLPAGLLQQSPLWLYTLVRRLPGSDRLALFQTCRQLAKQVMQSAGRITVYARPQSCTAEQYSFPQLSDGVPSILDVMARVLDFELPACAIDNSFGWARLGNLRVLQWHGCISQQDVAQLCEALEQGHLRQLTSFTLKAAGTGSDALYERLAFLLGKQLTQLNINHVQLMSHLPLFQQLSSVWLYSIPSASLNKVATDLNSLPRLCDFRIVGDYSIRGRIGSHEGHSSCDKKWTLSQSSSESVAALPWSHLQTVEFCGGVREWNPSHFSGTTLLQQAKVICTGNSRSEVEASSLCAAELHVLQRIQDATVLVVGSHADITMLPALWAVLPACVEHVRLEYHNHTWRHLEGNDHWSHVWPGMPENVTMLELRECTIKASQLESLIRRAPAHVRLVRLIAMRVKSDRGTFDRHRVLEDAPAHLKVVFA